MLFATCLLLQLPILAQQNNSTTQFRGPDRSGIYPSTPIADKWPAEGLKPIWKIDIGAGFSEIVVEGNLLYTLVGNQVDSISGTEQLASFDSKTGKELWAVDIDSLFFDEFGNGGRSTPLLGQNMIFCLSSYGKLTACNKKNGKIIWQVDFIKEFESTLPRWGFSTSPILVEDILIVEVGGTGSRAFMGFDPKTGTIKWAKGKGVASYCSPVHAKIDGVDQIIFANQTQLHSYSSKGDSLWTSKMSMNGPMAMPVLFDNNKIFVSTVRSKGFCVMEINQNGAKEILNSMNMKNDYSSSIYHDGFIYGFHVAALQCVSATTGEKKWVKRGLGKGTLILVGDKFIALSDKGKLALFDKNPNVYTELGRFQAIEGKSWTAPTFSNGKLYIRNLNHMVCYEL